MQRDPRVALAIANPMAGWACIMGCQIFGTATLLDVDTPEWEHGMKIFKYSASNFELGRPLTDVRADNWPGSMRNASYTRNT